MPKSSVERSARRWPEKAFACAAVVFAVLIAFGLRAFRLGVSWDISQDEIDYLQISHGVVRTMWVVGWNDAPFYLHPPLFFFLQAAYIKLFGIGGDLFQQIYGVRYLVAAFGGLSVGALLWLGQRLAGWPAGIAAAAIMALDPFVIRMNSRDFLEAPTVLWVLLGYSVLFSALVRDDRRPISWWRAVVAGVLFGLALLTKEKSIFVTLLPLGICFVLGWALPRTRSVLASVVALIVYAPYLAIVYAIGDWNTFLDQKLDGVRRLAGLLQITGFNQQEGPSLLDTLVYRLDEFATTYVLLTTGAVAVCVLLLTDLGKTPARRLLLSWTSGAFAFLGYSIVFGTLEEHFFYYLVIPSILATVVTAALVLRRVRERDAGGYPADAACLGKWGWEVARRRLARKPAFCTGPTITGGLWTWGAAAGAVLSIPVNIDLFLLNDETASVTAVVLYYLIMFLMLTTILATVLWLRRIREGHVRDTGKHQVGAARHVRNGRRSRLALEAAAVVFVIALTFWSAYVWVVVHTVPDNGYQRVASYVDGLPEASRVAVTSETAALLLPEHAKYRSVEALRADNTEYVVISSYLADRGWGEPPPEVYRWVTEHGQLVYGFEGSSSGLLGVWRLEDHAKGVASAPEERYEQERSVDSHRLEPAPAAQVGLSSNRGVSEESP